MKRLLMILGFAGVLGFSYSCKQCYTCNVGSSASSEYCSDVYSQTDLDILKAACESGGGTWTAK